jgi:HD superfamily phosphodiesterase
VTQKELFNIRSEFEHYIHRFADVGAELHPLLQLKAEHSECVAAEARELSSDLGWSASEQHSAEAIGLMHDIGRFSQFAESGTFSDSASVDHGERGAAVVEQAGWLAALPDETRHVLLNGIRYHNRLTIPGKIRDRSLAFLRLVRDADKLDIFRIVLDALERDGFRDLPTMLPNITLDRSPSPQLLDEILHRRSASLTNVRSLADFLLMQVSWVYDLNYAPTLQRFHDRGILSRILGQLDGDTRVHAFAEDVRRLVLTRIGRIEKGGSR